jgi:hypothetical protein
MNERNADDAVNESKAKGGYARAQKLSPDERKEIAKKAAETRWQLPQATHVGEIQIGDSRPLPCAVLTDGRRVLSERGVGRALGKGFGGKDFRSSDGAGRLPFYLTAKNLNPFISDDLMMLVTKPIVYKEPRSGGRPAHGVEATALPKVCDVWLKARDAGVLTPSQQAIAVKADILMRGLAHTGIIALVDEATGYQEVRDRNALQQILDRFIGKELAKWVRTFPDEFYGNVFRLKGWKFDPGSTKRPMMMAKLTADLVYSRLAPGVLEELRRLSPKDEHGRRRNKLFQWLTPDIGHPALRDHMSGVIFLAKANDNWDVFYRALNRAAPQFGKTLLLPLPDEPVNGQTSTESAQPSLQSLSVSPVIALPPALDRP